MNYGVLRNRIKTLAKDMRDAKQFGQEEEFQEDLKSLRFIVQKLTEEAVQYRNDSAFFEGELEDKGEDKWSPVVEEYRKRRQKRLDAKEEEGRWVTTENDHKVHLNEEGVPDKGNPYVLAVMNKGREEKPVKKEPVTKSRLNDSVADVVKTDISFNEKVSKLKKLMTGMPKGTKIKMPDSWEDDGKVPTYTYDGMRWNGNDGFNMSEDDMANYLLSEDEDDRPKVVSVPRSEESKEKSREKRESKKHYAMMPDGSINGHYTNDFHNDHVSQEERDSFAQDIKDTAFIERGFDNERALYRKEANAVGDKVVEEVKRRAKLRKGDMENAPVSDAPQVEDIYDVLRDVRDFGPPEGFKVDVKSDLDEERTNAVVKEALSRYPTDWLKDASHTPVIHIYNEVGRSNCVNGRFINIYAKTDLGDGEIVEANDRGLVNTLAHELGHYIEDANQKVGYSARDCLWERGKDSEIVDVEPGYQGYKDSFFHTYMGKIYPGYGQVTEIISVLMEHIGNFDPFSVMQGKEYDYGKQRYTGRVKDKESLGYILGVLAGL